MRTATPKPLYLHMRITKQQRQLILAMARRQGITISQSVMQACNLQAEQMGLLKSPTDVIKERKANNG